MNDHKSFVVIYFFVDENPMPYLVVSLVLLLVAYYISLFGLSNKNTLRLNLKISLKKFPKVFPFYLLILITNAAYLVFIFYVFFLTFAKASIVVPSIILLILIVILNLERPYIMNVVSRK